MNQITIEELHERLQKKQPVHVLDVREQDEYDAYNIGARHFPLSQLRHMDTEPIDDWKDEEIIVHCRSGKRSLEACLLLQTIGFAQPVNLLGGIDAWKEKYGAEQLS